MKFITQLTWKCHFLSAWFSLFNKCFFRGILPCPVWLLTPWGAYSRDLCFFMFFSAGYSCASFYGRKILCISIKNSHLKILLSLLHGSLWTKFFAVPKVPSFLQNTYIQWDCAKFSCYFKQFGSSMSTSMVPSLNVLPTADILSLNRHSLKIPCLAVSFCSSCELKHI